MQKLKLVLVSAFVLGSIGCAVLNKDGARVKVVRDASVLEGKCEGRGGVKLRFGEGVGLGQADNNVDRLRNYTAKAGGNVLVNNKTTDFGGGRGEAYHCPDSVIQNL